jgi:putative ABC transport system ATP-binding protein
MEEALHDMAVNRWFACLYAEASRLPDEPTGALDSTTTEEVLAIFDDLNAQGMTILLVTHEQEVGERAQRIIHFRDGRISH